MAQLLSSRKNTTIVLFGGQFVMRKLIIDGAVVEAVFKILVIPAFGPYYFLG